ncbi:TPA: hypothetical protein ACGSTL_001160 [Vibrio parahaemolyticus]|uniref:hypothetical protein n=1 Tax=Vibrio campbellii TaxID=680 RepID=UPI001F075190|nr:hypothetical protein [Vibrio campbellii]UMM06583.1 hypothetical protein MKR81_26920 [Vibrio campbellii]
MSGEEHKPQVRVRGGRNSVRTGVSKLKEARQQFDEQNPADKQDSNDVVLPTGAKEAVNDDLAISTVTPDPTNSRDFPVVKPSSEEAFLKANEGKDAAYVVLDKGVIINKTPKDHYLYHHIQSQIDEVIALSGQIESGGGLYQPIEVYRAGGVDYRIVYGHRRFYSVVYLVGWDSVWSFKVLRKIPEKPKLRQFVENNSQKKLALHEKLRAFVFALEEAKSKLDNPKASELMKLLGVPRNSFYRYMKLTSSQMVMDAIQLGVGLLSDRKLNPLIKQAEQSVKEGESEDFESAMRPLLAQCFVEAGREIPVFLQTQLSEAEQNEVKHKADEEPEPHKPTKRGRRATSYTAPRIKSSNAVKTLLTQDVTKMEITGVEWGNIDWEDKEQVNHCLAEVVKHLESLIDE